MKQEGKPNDLIERLKTNPAFAGIDLESTLDASRYIGRAPEQVDAFVRDVVGPIRDRYDTDAEEVELKV